MASSSEAPSPAASSTTVVPTMALHPLFPEPFKRETVSLERIVLEVFDQSICDEVESRNAEVFLGRETFDGETRLLAVKLVDIDGSAPWNQPLMTLLSMLFLMSLEDPIKCSIRHVEIFVRGNRPALAIFMPLMPGVPLSSAAAQERTVIRESDDAETIEDKCRNVCEIIVSMVHDLLKLHAGAAEHLDVRLPNVMVDFNKESRTVDVNIIDVDTMRITLPLLPALGGVNHLRDWEGLFSSLLECLVGTPPETDANRVITMLYRLQMMRPRLTGKFGRAIQEMIDLSGRWLRVAKANSQAKIESLGALLLAIYGKLADDSSQHSETQSEYHDVSIEKEICVSSQVEPSAIHASTAVLLKQEQSVNGERLSFVEAQLAPRSESPPLFEYQDSEINDIARISEDAEPTLPAAVLVNTEPRVTEEKKPKKKSRKRKRSATPAATSNWVSAYNSLHSQIEQAWVERYSCEYDDLKCAQVRDVLIYLGSLPPGESPTRAHFESLKYPSGQNLKLDTGDNFDFPHKFLRDRRVYGLVCSIAQEFFGFDAGPAGRPAKRQRTKDKIEPPAVHLVDASNGLDE